VTLRGGCLFAGAGALELAVGPVLDVDPVWFVENDPAASLVLAHHWPGVPNYGDITTVDWDSVEPIDLLTGGFPCTDVSAAGKRAGLRPGTRSGLWSHMAYAINKLRPKLVVIENVRGLLSTDAHCDLEPCPWCLGDNEGRPMRALGAVLADLASIGYDARWCGIRASDVGAPHGRFRVFIIAWPTSENPDGEPSEQRWSAAPGQTEGWGAWTDVGGRGDAPITDPESVGLNGTGDPRERWPGSADGGGDGVTPDTAGSGREPGSGMGRRTRSAVVGDGASSVGDSDRCGGEGWGTAGLEGETRPTVGFPCSCCGAIDYELHPGQDCTHRFCGYCHDQGHDLGECVSCYPPEPYERGRWAHPVVPDGAGGVEPDEQGSGSAGGQQVGAVVGAGDRVSAGDQAEGVHGDGRSAPVLEWGEYEPAIRRWERIIGRPATAPTITGQRGGQQLSPVFTEWMMGWPDGWVTAVPGITRSDQIKLCGNGVVTQQAAWAARYLMAAIAGM
jgi:DNA (cytosine-5)-methyltransferase 1